MLSLPHIADRLAELSHREQVQYMAVACADALPVWEAYAAASGKIDYIESVVGTYHVVDQALPRNTLRAVDRWIATGDAEPLGVLRKAWGEPIVALQDDDVVFPERPLMAYYALYNLLELALGTADAEQAMVCYRQVNSALFAGLKGNRLTDELQAYANTWWRACRG